MKTEYLLNKELDNVLAALMPSNRLVCQVCLHTGLRVSDVLSLKTQQLGPRFWVTESKTKKRRLVGLPAPLLEDIKAQAGPVWAFPSPRGEGHRTRQAVWKDVKRASIAFRIGRNIGPHSLRKVFAADIMRKYGDIEKVRRALNHSSPVVTWLYVMAAKQLETEAHAGKRLRQKET